MTRTSTHGPLGDDQPIRGWNILSDSEPDARAVIAAASGYDINHLQLSHHIVHELRHVRDERLRGLVNRLTREAHDAGIPEVVVWDHTLYGLDYYPSRFRTGPRDTIDLDDPDFWAWFKQDYRDMLDRVPEIDGLVLTFIETGARVERQHSETMTTPQEKLAAAVNAVADVVVGERGLALYARTFAYTHDEYERIVGAVDLFRHPRVRLMMKEAPHDFFLTHPNNPFAGRIDRPTLVEFDTAGEFNGQGVIANTWPQHFLARWRDFAQRPNILGYVARTDRYGGTRIVGRPTEINLLALKLGADDPETDPEAVYDAFITRRYGQAALPHLKPAFRNAFDIVTSSLYTLGTNTTNHSALDHEPYPSSYARHVSGKWLDPPIVDVGHGVDRALHYWKDVIESLAPAWAKQPDSPQAGEIPEVMAAGWLTPTDQITEAFLATVLTEKDHGVVLAEASLRHVEAAEPDLSAADFEELRRHFERTLLTARLHRAAAASYFGFRVYARGESFRTASLMQTVRAGLADLRAAADAVRDDPVKPAVGQWDRVRDAERAMRDHRWITEEGWPARTHGHPNAYAGLTFPA